MNPERAGTPAHRHLQSVPDNPRPVPAPPAARRPDLMALVWAFPPAAVGCAALTSALGVWALALAAVLLVAIVSAIVWSTGGER